MAASLQVAVGRHEGGEAESGLGHPADKEMGLRLGLAAGGGYGPPEAKFFGQGSEPNNGQWEGHFAAQGVDAISEMAH